jgi:Domain of unknown function (DUF4145)
MRHLRGHDGVLVINASAPPKYVAPAISLNAFSCPVCGALADQQWFKLAPRQLSDGRRTPTVITADVLEGFRDEAPPTDHEKRLERNRLLEYGEKVVRGTIFIDTAPYSRSETELVNLYITKCRSCQQISVWHHDKVLYPTIRYHLEPNADMNEDIKSDFLEAISIFDLSPRGAAALLRLCIQKLCKQLGQAGENINDDIGSLVKLGLDTRIQKILDVVRVIGNEAVHPAQST